MTVGLGLDGGGSALRWCLADAAGVTIARGEAAAITGHVFDEARRAQADATLAAAAAAILAAGRPAAVMAGITGLSADTDPARHVAATLSRLLALPAGRIAIGNDMEIAYRSVFAPGQGILVYGGTGSIGFHVAADGRSIRVGGHGNLIDDAGSGFWIAAAAVRAILRAEDFNPGDGWSTPLGRVLARAIGGSDWNTVRAFVYGGDRGRVAAVARLIVEADDPVARGLARSAGQELARLATILTARVGALPIVFAGGVSRSAAILESFRAALPGRDVRVLAIDAARGAAIIAAKSVTS